MSRSARGIPVTALVPNPGRPGSAVEALRAIERLVNEADRLDLIDPDERCRSALEALSRSSGVWPAARPARPRTFRLTESELERRFLRLVMPRPGCRCRETQE